MIGIQDQYFGTEIEMTGITRQRAAEVVAELFGTEAVHRKLYAVCGGMEVLSMSPVVSMFM